MEVTASSLIKCDLDGNPLMPEDGPQIRGGLIIHAGLLKGRPDPNMMLHTHTPNVMGVCGHKIQAIADQQHAMRFYIEMKYHDFEGFEFDPDMTGKLMRDLEGGIVCC